MNGCGEVCTKPIYHLDQDCCRARWLVTSFSPHALAMLDRWQTKDSVIIGKQKALERRKAVVKMAKDLSKEKHA